MRYLRKEPRRRPDSAALLRNAIAEYLGIDDQTAVYGAVPGPGAADALGHRLRVPVSRSSRRSTTCSADA